MKKITTLIVAILLNTGLLCSQPSITLVNLVETANLIVEKEEDPLVKTVALFQSELAKFNAVEQAIVNSMIAECLWAYLQQNRWEIFNRTPLANPDLTDIRTWDTRLLLQQTIAYYQASLQPVEALQKLRVRDYKEILKLGDDESEIQRPTMFDLLAHRAIDAWSQDDLRLTQPQDGFLVDNLQYFSRSSIFGRLEIPSADTLSLDYQIFKTYQLLSQFHVREYNREVLIPLTLQRMAWVRKKAVFEDVDLFYQYALVDYVSLFPYAEDTVAAQIYWALAEFHNELGNHHNSVISEDHRWNKKYALYYATILQNRFAYTRFANPARAMTEQIQMPNIGLQMQEILLPNQHNLFLMNFANVDTAYFFLYRLSDAEMRNVQFISEIQNFQLQGALGEIASRNTFFRQWQTAISNPEDFQTHRVELSLDPLPVGYYVLFASTNKDISANEIGLAAQFFGVSELAYAGNSEDEKLRGIVLNRRTGKPISGVSVRLLSREYDWQTRQTNTTELATLTSARNGRFEYTTSKEWQNVLVELQHKSDVLLPENFGFGLRNFSSNESENRQMQSFLFTDRAIYRPGQIVYFKGILVERNGDENRIVTHTTTTVKLFDANHREISSVEVNTNEFGSFSGNFVLPSRTLNGQFHIRNEVGRTTHLRQDFGAVWFSVEEYKRPSFEVVFDPLTETHRPDQEVIVSGVVKTYSGASLGNSTVKFRVVRSVNFPMWRRGFVRPPVEETVISQGSATTDEDGRFLILFTAHSDRRIPTAQNPTYTFTITIDATDVSGETQQGVQRIPISQRALNVSLNTRPFMDKTKDSVLQISSTNLLGEKTPSCGTIKVFRLAPNQRLLRNRLWETPNIFTVSETEFVKRFPNDPYSNENNREQRERILIFEKPYNTENTETFVLSGLPRWQNGDYVYTIETQDMFGNAVKHEDFFTVFSPRSERRTPLNEIYYTIFPHNTFEPGETASFIIGSASRVDVFYEIRGKNGVLEQRMISLNNEQRRIEFRIREEHRGNLSLQVWSVKDNRIYNTGGTISVPFSNKQINISFETFRDNLMPNAQENWTLNLLSNDKKPLQGELLLSMYDASLDVFRKNHWHNLNLNQHFHTRSRWELNSFWTRRSQQIKSPPVFTASLPVIQHDRFSFEPPFWGRRIMPLAKGTAMRTASAESDMSVESDMLLSVSAVAPPPLPGMSNNYAMAMDAEQAEEVAGFSELQTPEIFSSRTNLNETAFFFPHLRSDENGKVAVSFTVPESLTRWRIQGLAHTKDLRVGINEWSAVTQKNLMIHPNMPRFLREGDVFKLQARVVNLTTDSISGEASLCWTLSNQFGPISTEDRWTKDFSLAPLQNTSVVWAHRINRTGLLNLNFSARAGNHTDGEIRTIPVLSNRAMLTETIPMFALPRTERTFTFSKLANPNSNTLAHHRLTLEIATNPIWFAVQALPELSSPNSDNSIALFGAYFANAMSMDILQRNPEIKTVFNRWKMENSETLKSNLETNQDLKTVLLDETPWLLQAESETRQKQNIALFFDENNVRNLQADVLARLKNLQLPNGGFTWHPGGRADLWSTQYIVQGLQRLHSRNIERDNFELKNMLQNALKYCDEQHVERYSRIINTPTTLSRQQLKIDLSANDIQYLYLRTYFANEHPISSEMAEVLNIYDSLARANWRTQSRLLQGILALYFDLKGEQKLVQDIMQNFQRLALKSPEFGMWWRSEPSWLWFESPIETQSQLIETFEKLGRSEDVENMKRWLLSQKRTTRWNTPKASVEAVYALLLGVPNLSENTNVEILIGNERITPPTSADAGSGYFTKFWNADEINARQAQITIRNRGNSTVWGGVYWQYFENLDRVTPAATPLSVRKTLFVERTTDRGVILEPIPKEGLKIGDKVVARIQIRTDRNLDFVHLKDLRAAAFEPVDMRSGYRSQDGLFYYQDAKDVSMNFYFTHLPRGTYVFEYRMNVSQIGNFSNGFTTIQCLYAPEFSAQSQGERVVVN